MIKANAFKPYINKLNPHLSKDWGFFCFADYFSQIFIIYGFGYYIEVRRSKQTLKKDYLHVFFPFVAYHSFAQKNLVPTQV